MYNVTIGFRSGSKVNLFLDQNILGDFEKFYREKSATERTYYYLKSDDNNWGVIDFSQVEMMTVKESENIGEKS